MSKNWSKAVLAVLNCVKAHTIYKDKFNGFYN